MTFGFTTDREVYDAEDPEETELGRWIRCPECGSENAALMFWGEGVDMDVECPDCDAHYGVR